MLSDFEVRLFHCSSKYTQRVVSAKATLSWLSESYCTGVVYSSTGFHRQLSEMNMSVLLGLKADDLKLFISILTSIIAKAFCGRKLVHTTLFTCFPISNAYLI